MSNRVFEPNTPTGQCVAEFWESLHQDRRVRADRQARSALRRAQTLTDVVMVPAYHRLLHAFAAALEDQTGNGAPAHTDRHRLRLAAIAGLLAHTRQPEPIQVQYRYTIAVQMAGRKKKSQGPRVSDLRFRRLLQESDVEALYPMLRRTLALMDRAVDIHAMAADVWFWSERQRRQWAYDYYAALQPAHRAGAAS